MLRPRHLRGATLVMMVLFVTTMLAGTTYTLWRLRSDAIASALEITALQTRGYEDFLTQSLHVTELAVANTLPLVGAVAPTPDMQRNLVVALRHAPFLRSMSLLDGSGRILLSSNPANVGVLVDAQNYLPPASATLDLLRIGAPWEGRDFADGRASTAESPVPAQAANFIPVTRTLMLGTRSVTLLVALNPDYFLDHVLQTVDVQVGSVQVLRYDSTLLMTTSAQARPGTLAAQEIGELGRGEREAQQFEQPDAPLLIAMRSSRLYPFVVVTQLQRDDALRPWRAEARTLLAVVLPSLALISLMGWLYDRRKRQFAAHHAELERVRQINATVFDVSAQAIIITDLQANIIAVNAAFTRITGYSAQEVLGHNPRILSSGRHGSEFYAQLWQGVLHHGAWHGELVNRHRDGHLFDMQLSITVSCDGAGHPQHYISVGSDISERRAADEKLHLAASVFTHAREGITITAADGSIIDVNDAFTRITGYSRSEVLGRNPRLLSSGRQGKEFYTALFRDLNAKGHWYGEVWNRRKDGQVYAEMQTISVVRDAQGRPSQYVALFADITASKEHEQQLEHIAHYDALTNLPNRVLLADRLHQGMAQARRSGQRLAVAFLDLDGFKTINDLHGHEAGDQLLIAVAARMKLALREGDSLARLGGDEFVAVLIDLGDIESSVTMISRLLAAAAQPLQVGVAVLQVSASLGITFYPQAQEIDADQLLRQADQAMYQAKLAGKNRYHVFDAELDSRVRGHHETLERIRLALDQREFVLHYQPKVNMRSGQVTGAEALIRWQHPTQGLLLPAVFLPVIEDHPLAVEIGEWVIATTLAQLETWHAAGLDLPVSVNVGARQLQQSGFVTRLRELLAQHPLVQPCCLELEVLETSALEDVVRVSQVMQDCRHLGVSFSMDDFGTGYSSLTYLKRLPVSQLKIDQSFVRDMLDDPDDLAILEGVLGLATAFGREVIAEGVETVAHGSLLLQLGCELAQGYGIARPMPAHDMPAWAKAWRPDPAWADLPAISRDDLPLLFAGVEHRAWVLSIGKYLRGEGQAPAPLDLHQCRFGRWLDAQQGLARGGAHIDVAHRRTHALAHELLALLARGEAAQALALWSDLQGLRDAFLVLLQQLVRQHT